MDLKLTNIEAVAIMNSLQHYLKEVEKMKDEKGVQIEKKTLKGLISKIESMPAGEVQQTSKDRGIVFYSHVCKRAEILLAGAGEEQGTVDAVKDTACAFRILQLNRNHQERKKIAQKVLLSVTPAKLF